MLFIVFGMFNHFVRFINACPYDVDKFYAV